MTTRAAGPDSLDEFIGIAKRAGLADDVVVALLAQNGWPQRRIYARLSEYYAGVLGVPVPVRGEPDENPRDAFYYVLNFITLGFWTTALGQLFYDVIARAFPDAASRAYPSQPLLAEIAWQLATVIVAFPAFVFIGRLIATDARRRPGAARSPIRAWITYVALIVAALVVLGDAIWFLEALLRGELTIRFVLDSLVLLVLGGGVFAYYLAGLQRPHEA